MIGSTIEAYTRLLVELHHKNSDRRAYAIRLRLQDVLCFLRDRAAEEQGLDPELVQNSCEARASELVS